MSTTKQPSQELTVGSEVRVKKGVTAPNRPDMPMSGWRGRVYQMSGTICLVHWSNATLEAIRSIHRELQQWDGGDFRVMWLQEDVLEVDAREA